MLQNGTAQVQNNISVSCACYKEASIASVGKKKKTRKEVKEAAEGSFSPSQATQRIPLRVSLGYLFCIMISDIPENMKGICEPKTKSKMVLENDSL